MLQVQQGRENKKVVLDSRSQAALKSHQNQMGWPSKTPKLEQGPARLSPGLSVIGGHPGKLGMTLGKVGLWFSSAEATPERDLPLRPA